MFLCMALCAVISRCSSLLVVAHVSLAYSIAGNVSTVLLKSFALVFLSGLEVNSSLIELNALYPALIRRVISFSISRSMFTSYPKRTYWVCIEYSIWSCPSLFMFLRFSSSFLLALRFCLLLLLDLPLSHSLSTSSKSGLLTHNLPRYLEVGPRSPFR